MAKFLSTLAQAAACITLTASSGIADEQAITAGDILKPAQISHIFDAACLATAPADVAAAMDVFGFDAIALEGDTGWISPNGGVTIAVNTTPAQTTCTMSIVADLGGDGGDLYEALESHLSAHLNGTLPEADYVDGGVIWGWGAVDTAFTLAFTEVEGAFGITLKAQE